MGKPVDCEFIRESEVSHGGDTANRELRRSRTGWEEVIFEVEDESAGPPGSGGALEISRWQAKRGHRTKEP